MSGIKEILYRLKDNSLNFISIHKKKILSISLVSIGLFSLKILYDYQQEAKEKIYTSIDESQYFECTGEDGRVNLFALNRSPQNRDNGTYGLSDVILSKKSSEGKYGEPYIKKAITDVTNDFIYIWANDPRWDRFNEDLERPRLKLNRITGDLHQLESVYATSCGLLYDDCWTKDFTYGYEIKECVEISEKQFQEKFDHALNRFREERKF